MTLVVSPPIRGAPDTGLESILEFARSKVAERLRKIHPMAEIVLDATTVERKDSKTLQKGGSPALTGVCSDQEGPVTAGARSALAQRTHEKVRVLQSKLHRAAKEDLSRTFGILYDKVVTDPEPSHSPRSTRYGTLPRKGLKCYLCARPLGMKCHPSLGKGTG